MYYKHKILRILLPVLICCSFVHKVNAYCSLEIMKKYAMEACEHLFLQNESRDKRSLSYEFNLIDGTDYDKYNDQRHYISRSIYPPGGYLKVDPEHFHMLSQIQVLPKYKPKKVHHAHRDRVKRHEYVPSYNNIPYCCYHKCQEDFFC